MVAEVPQVGNATYVFARPADIREFVRRYATTTHEMTSVGTDRTANSILCFQQGIRLVRKLTKPVSERYNSFETFLQIGVVWGQVNI